MVLGVGDETRAWGPPFVGNESCYFLSVNRNKKVESFLSFSHLQLRDVQSSDQFLIELNIF